MPKEVHEKSSNSALVLALIEVLEREASLFETFLELLEKQQQALVRNDLDAINELTEKQREKTLESTALSRRREDLVKELSSDGNTAGDLTISKLIQTVSSGRAMQLARHRDNILELHEKIMTVRSQNNMLINRSRENIVKTMELLGRIKTPEGSYRKEGQMTRTETNLALDRRA
ncbi:MAG: flagellar protein FlgN [Candidatus Zixiibacteriota bacterium]|nr:MAG: flagellar protein FlgN [candidate division Zixibacteria bacterium]